MKKIFAIAMITIFMMTGTAFALTEQDILNKTIVDTAGSANTTVFTTQGALNQVYNSTYSAMSMVLRGGTPSQKATHLVLYGGTIDGDVIATGDFTSGDDLISGDDVTVGDDLVVTDDASVGGDLVITGAITGVTNITATGVISSVPATASTQTTADSGDGNAATDDYDIDAAYNELTCSDTDGCTVTILETSAVAGMVAIINNISANAITIADQADVVVMAGGTMALGQDDTLTFIYTTAGVWVETSRSDN